MFFFYTHLTNNIRTKLKHLPCFLCMSRPTYINQIKRIEIVFYSNKIICNDIPNAILYVVGTLTKSARIFGL